MFRRGGRLRSVWRGMQEVGRCDAVVIMEIGVMGFAI